MPDERRNSVRHPLALRVQIRTGEHEVEGRSVDLSRSGIFVVVPKRFDEGVRVSLEICDTEAERTVTTEGRVVHILEGVGIGVAFDHPRDGLREELGELIALRKIVPLSE